MLTPETVWFQDELQVRTEGRGTCDITRDVTALVGRSEVRTGYAIFSFDTPARR